MYTHTFLRRWPLLLLISLLAFASCSEKAPTPPPAEADLQVTLNPDPGSATARTSTATYAFQVVINSAMPAGGVDVAVTYRRDSDNGVIFQQTVQSSTSPVNITINNIALNDLGTVTVTVTSRSKPANTVTRTFKLSRK